MTTDNFTEAARAEAERRHPDSVDVETGEPVDDWGFEEQGRRDFRDGAEWARTHLAAQEPTDEECIYILSIVCSPFGEEDKKSEWAPAAIQRCREAMVRARAARRDEES